MKNRSSLNLASFTMCLLAALLVLAPAGAHAQLAGNQACAGEDVFYNPGNGEDIIVPHGYKVEVFAKNLNFPTGIAFQGTKANSFKVFVVESGTGLPGKCNNNELFGGKLDPHNPFTPDILEFDNHGNLLGSFGKPTADGGGFQPDGPAIGLAFENGFHGGRLFGSDSNQGARGAPGLGNNTSRIVMVDLKSRQIEPFITGLPTGDHPTEQVLVQGNYIYWSQGSATNSGVTGHDNGAGGNQHDIACQDITLSQNVFDSGDGHTTSGYSNHRRVAARRRREGVRERHPARHVHGGHPAGQDQQQEGRARVLGLPQSVRVPLPPQQPPAGRVHPRHREWRGRARRASDQ